VTEGRETVGPATGVWVSARLPFRGGHLAVYFQDPSERREAEEALRQNEARWRALIGRGADVITISSSPWTTVRAQLASGASGYLVKSTSMKELLTAVRRVARSHRGRPGENVILAVPRAVIERVEDERALSIREQEILLLAARGLSNRRIAEELHISEATVKRHLANVYEKMGVGSRGEASQKVLSEGWITAGDLTRSQ
jgi:DNA-binding NarL/FixJ family response regulator